MVGEYENTELNGLYMARVHQTTRGKLPTML